ncbi:MAG TPA: FMN-binding protein [Treponemataceae bacterium]|nr:FMN-binding protein [Treponemataceae bacterium]HPS43658.1 FMN-binding protein [Treponemataceae bacterium]
MKTMIKLSFILAAYAVVACVGLAFVYTLTAPRIAEAAKNEVNSALREVCPDATDFIDVSGKVESGSASISFDRAYVAKKGDAAVGMVLQVTGPTYKSSTLLVAVNMARQIIAVRFTANTDTPGLGSKTAESPFIDQFRAKSVDDAFKAGSDVQAISGATISSKAVATILKVAGFRAGEYLAVNYGGAAGSGAEPILAESAPMEISAALSDLFPGAEFTDVSGKVANTVERSIVITGAWLAKKDGALAGVAVQAKGQTYKASTLVVGVRPDRTLAGVRVNATSDSKNYGYAMVEPDYYGKYAGKRVDDAYLVKTADQEGDVDAISGATVSSLGFANIVKVAAFEGASYLAGAGLGAKGKAAPKPFVLNVIPEEE